MMNTLNYQGVKDNMRLLTNVAAFLIGFLGIIMLALL
tara:strand:- start:12205 stop:12315 length:111 start_codon:yes stop_codon:yes gene_type:complete